MAHKDLLMKVEVPRLNELYHVSWASNGCVWRLHWMDETTGECIITTPKTHKSMKANLSDLRHTRKNEEIITNKKFGYEKHINPQNK